MFVRRKANKSGSYSVQVVEKRYGRYVVVRSFGASKDEDALKRMEHSASEFIASYNGQGVLDFQNSGAVTSAAIFSSIASIVLDGRDPSPVGRVTCMPANEQAGDGGLSSQVLWP